MKKIVVMGTLRINMRGRFAGNNGTRGLPCSLSSMCDVLWLQDGATARQVQDMQQLVDASYFLELDEAAIFSSTLPQMRWFQAQGEGLGLESRIAGASRIIQWGFDETTLDGVSCLNQWAMVESPLEEGGGGAGMGVGVTIVTLECAGIVPGGTADEVVAHIEKAWERGQAAVGALRAELGIEDRDVF
jgi:hypothetical protein